MKNAPKRLRKTVTIVLTNPPEVRTLTQRQRKGTDIRDRQTGRDRQTDRQTDRLSYPGSGASGYRLVIF